MASHPTADIQAIVTLLPRRSNRECEQGIQLLNLANVNLHGAELIKTNLSKAHLSWADLRGADLRAAKVTQEQLDEADGDSSTTLPEGLHMPENWKK